MTEERNLKVKRQVKICLVKLTFLCDTEVSCVNKSFKFSKAIIIESNNK